MILFNQHHFDRAVSFIVPLLSLSLSLSSFLPFLLLSSLPLSFPSFTHAVMLSLYIYISYSRAIHISNFNLFFTRHTKSVSQFYLEARGSTRGFNNKIVGRLHVIYSNGFLCENQLFGAIFTEMDKMIMSSELTH